MKRGERLYLWALRTQSFFLHSQGIFKDFRRSRRLVSTGDGDVDRLPVFDTHDVDVFGFVGDLVFEGDGGVTSAGGAPDFDADEDGMVPEMGRADADGGIAEHGGN